MTPRPSQLVIMIDWSASSTVGPAMRDAALDDPARMHAELQAAPPGAPSGWIFGAASFVASGI